MDVLDQSDHGATALEGASAPISEAGMLPAFSVVIEWDNPLLSEVDRCREMLKELGGQVRALEPALPASPQIIFVYDRHRVDAGVIEGVIEQAGLRAACSASVCVLAADGLAYYDQKNFGAQAATGEIIVFLDSDVIPQPGWLEGLLEAFHDRNVGVVGGNTFISPLRTLYDKAFALFWFFPVERAEEGQRSAGHFFANNVAFRHEIFQAYPFPNLPTFRGQCSALAQALRQKGVRIFNQQRSTVSHPPPNGFNHLISRAMCQGFDHVYRFSPVSRRNPVPFARSLGRFARHIGGSLFRVFKYRGHVGLGPVGAIGALGIAVFYYSVKLAGEWLTLVSPGFVPKRFRI